MGREHYCEMCADRWRHDDCADDGCAGVTNRLCPEHEDNPQQDDPHWSWFGLGMPL